MPEVIRQRKLIPVKSKLLYQNGLLIPEEYEKKIKILPMEIYRQKAFMAEPSGRGTDLIVDTQYGRVFRHDVEMVKEIIDAFVEMYSNRCEMFDEDPAHEYIEITSYNELYGMLDILPSIAGSDGWTNTEEYRVSLIFEQGWVEDNVWTKRFGERYYFFNPRSDCPPESYEYLMEVS